MADVNASNSFAYPAPAALVTHCMRASSKPATSTTGKVGKWDLADVTALYQWMAERDAFADYESWLTAGMVAKCEFGDAGLALWEITHDSTVDSDTESKKWNSFAEDAGTGGVALGSILARAHGMGWKGTIRPSTAAMFDGAATVAAIAQAAGATLQGAPGPVGGSGGGVPMLEGQAELARIGAPILDEFLAATSDAPLRPIATDYPTLPDACASHGLFAPLRLCVDRILAMADTPKTFRGMRCAEALAILSLVHQDTYDSILRRLRNSGCTLAESKIKLAAAAIADKVERAFVKNDGWQYDTRSGLPESDNSDNVAVFLGMLGCELRWNAWLERAEIRGGTDADLSWPQWTYVDDAIVGKLRTRGNRTKTRFRPGKEFFWESLVAHAQQNRVDPALDVLAELQAKWDGVPRLLVWLSHCCGTPCDPYHQSVARMLVGGMVRRIRQPGVKQDEIAIFYGPQGTGKSTLAALLAPCPEWFSDEVMLGDASKELVLSLAGKCVIEISEMGMRGTTNAAAVKAMLSRQVDRGRTAYARTVSERPRRNVFVGTTNESTPLTDPTGNRRFLPVRIDREIDLAWLRQNVGQLVGEAAHHEAAGATFAIPREVWGSAAEQQEAAREESDTEIMLSDWFAETPITATAVTYITAADLVHLSSLVGWRGSNSTRSLYMKRLGFRKETPMIGGKKTRVWVRGPNTLPRHIEHSVRYVVGTTQDGRPRVTIQSGAGTLAPIAPGGLPPLPR